MAWQIDNLAAQSGRTVVITGGNSGIGLEAAKVLAAKGARVIIACRDENKAQSACDEIATATSGNVEFVVLDLASGRGGGGGRYGDDGVYLHGDPVG